VDDGGEVVLARDYSPFGVVRSESGTGSSGYGFTGEQWDGYTQFVYLRARWMDPVSGRFISQDPWPGSIRQPSSLHKYLYVSANPVNLVDPLGLYAQACNQNYEVYNLTDWLVREMHHQSTHWPVRGGIAMLNKVGRFYDYQTGLIPPQDVSISFLLNALTIYMPGRLQATYAQGAALLWWAQMVRDGARWDFKDQIGSEFQEEKTVRLCDHEECRWYEYSMPGNIFYAYVGRSAGFSEFDIRAGAVYAQQNDPDNDPALNDWFLGLDQADDQAALDLGFEMYRLTRGSSDETTVRDAFKTALTSHKNRLAQGKIPIKIYSLPASIPVGADGPEFPLGYFDGTNFMGWLGR
jgi:RHS repeat-associated protein